MRHQDNLWNRYQVYLLNANDGNGNDVTSGCALLTFDEWLQK